MYSTLNPLGFICAIIATAMLLPIPIAIAHDELEFISSFLVSAGFLMFIAGGLMFMKLDQALSFKRREILLFNLFLWTLVPLLLALPFHISQQTPNLLDAYFESVSFFTTSGGILPTSSNPVSHSFLFWRGLIAWLGGAATLLMLLLAFAPAHIGGTPDRAAHPDASMSMTQKATIKWVLLLYAGMTATCFLALTIAGLSPLEAIGFAFSSLSTSGFNPTAQSLEHQNFTVQAIIGLFTLIGATSIVWQRAIIVKRWSATRQYRETYVLIALTLLIGLVFARSLYSSVPQSALNALDSLWIGLLSAISIISTSAIEVHDGGFGRLSPPLLLFLVLIGGSSFSTSGGIRLFRVIAMTLQAKREMYRLIHPYGIKSDMTIGIRSYDLQTLKAIWLVFLAFLATIACGTLALSATGLSFEASFIATISNLANAAPLYSGLEESTAGWISYIDMNIGSRSILILLMILGRMEILGLLIFLNPFFWRS